MMIQEAIKSGKPFRRKGTESWYVTSSYCSLYFYEGDVLADDWEVKQEPRELFFIMHEASIVNWHCRRTDAELYIRQYSKGEYEIMHMREVVDE